MNTEQQIKTAMQPSPNKPMRWKRWLLLALALPLPGLAAKGSCAPRTVSALVVGSNMRASLIAALFAMSVFAAGCSRAQPAPILELMDKVEVPDAIQSMVWHPNGKWLAIGYFNRDQVEVWDVQSKKPLFSVPSKRRPHTMSGQEALFSPDGKYLVVRDFLDTKNGEPKFPRTERDPNELPARADKTRYILARVWNIEQRKEIAQLKGPGSVIYGGAQNGMCWAGGSQNYLVVHRKTVVTSYELTTGRQLFELDLDYPFKDHPGVSRGYWKMACHPNKPQVAMEGAQFFKEAPTFGYPANSGATPIVIADIDKRKVVKVLFSATPLNGVSYTADGNKLISFGRTPIRVWDAAADFSSVGVIEDPPLNSGLMTAIPGYDGFLGISDALRIWNNKTLTSIYRLGLNDPDLFWIASHEASLTYAFAVRNTAYLYRLNLQKLKSLTDAAKK